MNEQKIKQTWLILQYIRLANELNEPIQPIINNLVDLQTTIESSTDIDEYLKFKTLNDILMEVKRYE